MADDNSTINESDTIEDDSSSDDSLLKKIVFSDSESEDDNSTNTLGKEFIKILVIYATINNNNERITYYTRDRLCWEEHVRVLLLEGTFKRTYRMELRSFNKLCALLDPFLLVDPVMSTLRTNKPKIGTEIIVSSFIRWVSGGSYIDIHAIVGVSVSSFYRVMGSCMKAILECRELAYNFPQTPNEITTAAASFKQLSTNQFLAGCVGVMDGLLLRIKVPAASEVGHVKSFYSGHYSAYGVNVQAACDHRCRFIEVCVVAPGGHNDITAYRKSTLPALINNLPIGKYVIGDNAYICSEKLLTPFSGVHKNDATKDTYNYYVSQLRMRIEMAFGLLTSKWRILRSPLQVKVKNIGKLFVCITRLHNYCINERLNEKENVNISNNIININNNNRNIINNEDDNNRIAGYLHSDLTTTTIIGHSMMRSILLEKIVEDGLSRPKHNVDRNK
jgi:DDE superfamily endonuclease